MKLFGIPVKIEPSFFLVVAVLGMSRSATIALVFEWIVVVLFSILLHEFGHAFAARAFGAAPSIRLYQMGGETSWLSETPFSPLKHLVVSLSGPAAGFFLGGCVLLVGPFFLLSIGSQISAAAYFDLIWVNMGWGLFNLLPMLPLDGGRVLTTLEEWLLRTKDQLVSHVFSFGVALTISMLAFRRSVWIAFLGIYFAYLNGSSLWGKWQTHRDLKLEPCLAQIGRAIENDEPELALDLINKVQKGAWTQHLKREVARLLVFLHITQNNFSAAEMELNLFNARFGGDYYLQGVFHFCRKEMAAAVPELRTVFDLSPDAKVGLMLGKALLDTKEFASVVELCEHPTMVEVAWQLWAHLQVEAFNDGQFQLSARAGQRAYEHAADRNVAYNMACALARDSDPVKALEWLRLAVAAGFSDREAVLSDLDLDAVRSLPQFGAIVETLDQLHDQIQK